MFLEFSRGAYPETIHAFIGGAGKHAAIGKMLYLDFTGPVFIEIIANRPLQTE